jgi:hypothetical protein
LGGAIGVATSGETISGAGDPAKAGAAGASMATIVTSLLVKAREDCVMVIPRIISTDEAARVAILVSHPD